jgi:hypothetical protein
VAGINAGKVVLAGFVAGIVANAIDLATGFLILNPSMRPVMMARNVPESTWNGATAIVAGVAVDFLFAWLIVFTYAAIRPRFGAGPKTAIVAGLITYLAGTFVVVYFTGMGLFPHEVFVVGSGCALLSTLGAALVGGKLYSE